MGCVFVGAIGGKSMKNKESYLIQMVYIPSENFAGNIPAYTKHQKEMFIRHLALMKNLRGSVVFNIKRKTWLQIVRGLFK